MFTKLKRHRQYQYTPRVYDPEKEKRNNRVQGRRELRFQRGGAKASPRSLIFVIAAMGLILYLIYKLSQVGAN